MLYSFPCMHWETLILDNRLVSGRQREMRCLTAPPFFLSWRRHWPLSWIQDEGAHKRAAWHRLRCRELWLKCLALSWGPKAEAAQLRANPAALASISSSLSARILITPVPSTCCAKHADNPLIHKPTHCHAISATVDGGGGEKMNAISLLLVSLSLSFLFQDMTYFCFPILNMFSPLSSSLWTFLSALLPPLPSSSLQGPLCYLWMPLIWTPRGSLARRPSSTPWRAPLSSVLTRAQVCVCVCWESIHGIHFFRYPHVQSIEWQSLSQALFSNAGSYF